MEIELDNWEFIRVRIPPEPPRNVEPDEMVACLWPFLRFFRLFGLCPVERSGSYLVAPDQIRSIGWVCTMALIIAHLLLLWNAYYLPWTRNNAHDFFFLCAYFCHVVPTGWYMIWKAGSLRKFVTTFRQIEILWRKYQPQQEDGLKRRCFKIFLFFVVQHILATALHHFVLVWQSGTFGKYLESSNNPHLRKFGPYTGGILRLCQLFSDFGWSFGDIFMTLMAVVLTRYYVRFNNSLAKRRLMLDFDEIEELRADHQSLNMVVVTCNRMFWSLFLWVYLGNMGYILGRLNYLSANWKHGWATSVDAIVWIDILWRLGYNLGVRLFLPSYLASRLHEEAHNAIQTVKRWPSFNGETFVHERNRLSLILRFEDQLYWTRIGFRPNGFFLISRPFMLDMVGSLLGHTIMILQYHTLL